MLNRMRRTWVAGGGALLLVVVVSGAVAAASIMTAITAPVPDPTTSGVVDGTAQTFVDVNGDGIADSCQTNVVADPAAATAALAAADLNGDGKISVSEAAQSGWVGGKNCNHGGYVSSVARAAAAACQGDQPADATDSTDATHATDAAEATDATDATDAPEATDAQDATDATSTTTSASTTSTTSTTTTCAASTTTPALTTDTGAKAPCVVTPVVTTPTTASAVVTNTAPNAHGKLVSEMARSSAVGGKNCNHGGAVSAVAKDHTARDAAKAARLAARNGSKHGKGHGHRG